MIRNNINLIALIILVVVLIILVNSKQQDNGVAKELDNKKLVIRNSISSLKTNKNLGEVNFKSNVIESRKTTNTNEYIDVFAITNNESEINAKVVNIGEYIDPMVLGEKISPHEAEINIGPNLSVDYVYDNIKETDIIELGSYIDVDDYLNISSTDSELVLSIGKNLQVELER